MYMRVHKCSTLVIVATIGLGLLAVGSGEAVGAGSQTVPITFNTKSTALDIKLDGVSMQAPQTVNWVPGSTHTLDLNSTQYLGSVKWLFTSWSDGGTVTHTIVTPSAAKSYTAYFVSQCKLSVTSNPPVGGVVTINPPASDGYYWQSTTVQMTANPTPGCTFAGFSGGVTSSTAITSFVMGAAPRSVIATFSCPPVPVSVVTSPAGLNVNIDGATSVSPASLSWNPGTKHTLQALSPQYQGSTSWIFSRWADSSLAVRTITTPASATTYTAQYSPQYRLTTAVSPPGAGVIATNPTSTDGYYPPTYNVLVVARAAANCTFVQFTGALSTWTNVGTVSMASAKAVSAQFSCVNGNGTQASSADSFVDSIGTNVHLDYTNTPYYTNYAMIKSRLVQLGIRHVRGGLVNTTLPDYYNRYEDLGKAGVKGLFVSKLGQSAAFITTFPSLVPDSFEGYEPPNELDISGDPNWVTALQSSQAMLYQAVKNDPATAQFPVLAPALTTQQAFTQVGDISAWFDVGNIHDYFGGRNPGTLGWGPNNYGSIEWNLNVERMFNASKPVMATETGYDTAPATNEGTPELVTGRYMPRVFLEQFRAGVLRTYTYELVDEGADPLNSQYNFGLIRNDGTPKPSFTALANLIGLLKDPGPAFVPGTLQYTLSGNTANVHNLLLEKRDGTMFLILWIEAPCYDVVSRQMITAPPQSVTITVGHAVEAPTVYSLADDGSMAASPAAWSGNAMTLALSDRVTVIAFP